jgi:L-threonine-O-3-phosphate decarboxylase
LQRAVREYGIPLENWLDLSTGISPYAWPVPAIPPSAWQRLPEDDDGLIEVARTYYGAPMLLPIAGSQAAIQALPDLRHASRVGIVSPGYNEHAQAWRRAGHHVEQRGAAELIANAERYDVVVLIHPNNPGGDRFDPQELLSLHAGLAERDGWLVVDEAFMDATPQHSLCAYAGREGLIVLRSVGKFFGLAGARAGFVCAAPALLGALREQLGPWTLAGPTRYVLKQALADRAWQTAARANLQVCGERLRALLTNHDLAPAGGCDLFQWCRRENAADLHRGLATRGILTRLFDKPASLRFGLPESEVSFVRLDAALAEVMR